MKRTNQNKTPEIAAGQIWEMADSKLHVTLIGRTLAHYKHVKTGAVRVPTSLINKLELEKFLIKNKATLVQS